ncbi:MAG: hypothetical protein EOM05_08475 [Clostridia bacterium]|nr:hypothetical protein [Clostridia bacterium]
MSVKLKISILAAIITIIVIVIILSRTKDEGLGKVSGKAKLIKENKNYFGNNIGRIYSFAKEKFGIKLKKEQGFMIILLDNRGYVKDYIFLYAQSPEELEKHIKKAGSGHKIVVIRNLLQGTLHPGSKEQELIKRINQTTDLYDYLVINEREYFSSKGYLID